MRESHLRRTYRLAYAGGDAAPVPPARRCAAGAGIIFISHALEEALEIADRITVLRDGKLVATLPAGELDRAKIVHMMVGRDVSTMSQIEQKGAPKGAPAPAGKERRRVLSVENVNMGSVVKNMSFSVFAGEVVGVFGFVGAGAARRRRSFAGRASATSCAAA